MIRFKDRQVYLYSTDDWFLTEKLLLILNKKMYIFPVFKFILLL